MLNAPSARPKRSPRRAIATALVLGALSPTAALAADLTVRLTGVRSGDGNMRMALFNQADGFRKEDRALAVLQIPAAPGAVTATFPGLAPGRYAIMAYHDENADGAMNRMFGMIPTEGYGLSNNPEVFGPPAFEPSAFDLPAAGTGIAIEIRY